MDIDYKLLFEKMSCETMILNTELAIIAATDTYCEMVHQSREYLIGKNVFVAFPNNYAHDGVNALKESLDLVFLTRSPHKMDVFRYDIVVDGKFEQRWWQPENIPIIVDNEIKYIVNKVTEMTEIVELRTYKTKSMQELALLTAALSGSPKN